MEAQYITQLINKLDKGPTEPVWLTKKGVKIFFSIGRDNIDDLVREGYVLATPLSDGKTSTRLHRCQDIKNYLEAKAMGQEPKKVTA